MQEEYLDHIQSYMDGKRYDTKDHKEIAKLVKKNFQEHNYNLTSTELVHFHESEIIMIMFVITKMKKKLDQFLWENLFVLIINIVVLFIVFLSKYGKNRI